jgi:hypothetical protein
MRQLKITPHGEQLEEIRYIIDRSPELWAVRILGGENYGQKKFGQ